MRLPLVLLLGLSLFGCSERPEPLPTLQLDAAYQLLFNDSLVGNALFALSIDQHAQYRIEAYTAPAGKIAGQTGNEVLELSVGTIDRASIRPVRFEHSVMQGDDLKRVRLDFDWAARQLRVSNATDQQTLALPPRTQDRLSYLIAAARLSAADPEALQEIRLATLEATEQVVLQVIGQQTVSVPAGTYQATGIRRVSLDGDAEREMWFADAAGLLPVKVVRRSDGNLIEMRLESLTEGPGQPVPD